MVIIVILGHMVSIKYSRHNRRRWYLKFQLLSPKVFALLYFVITSFIYLNHSTGIRHCANDIKCQNSGSTYFSLLFISILRQQYIINDQSIHKVHGH